MQAFEREYHSNSCNDFAYLFFLLLNCLFNVYFDFLLSQVKFVFSEEVVDYLNYKKASAINQIKEETGVDIKFYQDRKNRSLERKEHIAVNNF